MPLGGLRISPPSSYHHPNPEDEHPDHNKDSSNHLSHKDDHPHGRQNRQSPLSLLVVAFGVVFAFCFRNLLYLQTFAFQFAFRIYKPSHLTVN